MYIINGTINGINDVIYIEQTALHYAVRDDCFEVVLFLLENGANMHVDTGFGRTPAKVAYSNKMKLLFKHYEFLITLKEWRPWNHIEYPFDYRKAMHTLVLLAKTYIYKNDSNYELNN